MATTKVTNVSNGPRGIWSTSGLVMIEKGQTADVELAEGEEEGEYFKFGAAAAKAAAAPLDSHTKAELVEIAEAEGVTVADGATKAELVEAIEANRAG